MRVVDRWRVLFRDWRKGIRVDQLRCNVSVHGPPISLSGNEFDSFGFRE